MSFFFFSNGRFMTYVRNGIKRYSERVGMRLESHNHKIQNFIDREGIRFYIDRDKKGGVGSGEHHLVSHMSLSKEVTCYFLLYDNNINIYIYIKDKNLVDSRSFLLFHVSLLPILIDILLI